ncbi:MAG TPA: 50S ribosomal protein L23, partial [Patescibacteria group bacterium]|nr:50S ribosomal protein L23 [Patescibacteria group bacterium]
AKKDDAPKKAKKETAEKGEAVEAAPAAAKKATRGALAKDGSGEAHRVLLKPVFSEKSSLLQAQGKYVFIVAKNATKVDVAAAIRDLYGVKPASVRVIVHKGKEVRFGKFSGKEKDEKKAIVTLAPGQTLTVFEGA